MKHRLTALFLSLIFLFSSLIPAGAVSASSDFDELFDCFTFSVTAKKQQYAYYSPVKSPDDQTRYPLVIYLHGKFHGYTSESFYDSGLTYWASDEMQALFTEGGGAHLLMPRLIELGVSALQTDRVYDIIQTYIQDHQDSIDTDKIYLLGGSAGGGLCWNMLIQYPDLFSRSVILCSTKIPLSSEIKKVADIPIWMVSSKTDPIISYYASQQPTWEKLCRYSNVKEQCRWTVFGSKVTLPDASQPIMSHFLAKTIGYNFCTIHDRALFPGMTTFDGNRNTLSLSFENSIVQWLEAS